MAHHKSATKRIRTSEKAHLRNRAYKTRMKTSIKRIRNAEDKETAMAVLKSTYSIIDKLSIKGIIPKNSASNKKSRLTRYVNSMT